MTDLRITLPIAGATATEPRKYVKRPIPITAQRIDGEFSVETLEGTMRGKPGDYLITGVRGEQYPCDAGIFEATYTDAEAAEAAHAQMARDAAFGVKVRAGLGECTIEMLDEIKELESQEALEAAWDIINAIADAMREEADR